MTNFETICTSPVFTLHGEFPREQFEYLCNRITDIYVQQVNKALSNFFEPYFRKAGIKGDITKGKIKWRGIKMKVETNLYSTKYQLCQRGVDISPVFVIETPTTLHT
jgi:hypothetical protein